MTPGFFLPRNIPANAPGVEGVAGGGGGPGQKMQLTKICFVFGTGSGRALLANMAKVNFPFPLVLVWGASEPPPPPVPGNMARAIFLGIMISFIPVPGDLLAVFPPSKKITLPEATSERVMPRGKHL